VHSACRMPPGSRPPREAASANAASFTSPTLGSAIVERRAVGADPPHRASRTRARLEEPPKPSRPLSVAVAGKAPVSASSVVCAISWLRAHPLLRSRLRGIHLRGQSRVTHPGFRETHPVTRTPFRRIGSRALAALGLPESPSPHPSGCDPDEACACGLDQPVPPCLERRGEGPRTVFARDPPGGLVRLPRFVRARSRVPAVRFSAHISTGRRDRRCVRSTSALRNRSTRALVLRRFPVQRPAHGRGLSAPLGSRSLPGASRLRARPRERLLRVRHRSSGDARCRHLRARGRPMQTRPGGTALHGAPPTSAPGRSRPRALSSLGLESIPVASDTLVASSLHAAWGRQANPTRWLEGRQDRFRERLVKGVRFPDPGCLPSPVATRAAFVPRRERKPRGLHRRRGAHVMRIAELG